MTVRIVFKIAVIGLFLTSTNIAQAQTKNDDRGKASATKSAANELGAPPPGHMEVPNDPYLPVSREKQATGPAGYWSRDGYESVQVNVGPGGVNILNDAANEPSIAVDPNDPNRMAIGWRQFDNIASDFRQAGYGYTDDGGRTWTFPGAIEPGVFRSDPVLCADTEGDFYYNSLTASGDLSEFWCHVYKSTNGGATWDAGTYAYGGDKQWMVVDLNDGIGQNNMYAYWTRWYTCPGCSGHFTRSYNGGQSFLPTINVDGNPLWGTLAVGPDSELYIAGDGFTVTKSSTMYDEGLTPQWDFTRTVDLDGSMSSSGGPNPGGLLGQVWIAVDHSDGPSRGYVYLLCSVNRSSTSDPLDVMFSRSTDGGSTWSAPVRVNDDPEGNGAYQWFGTMSVAPNGRIDVIWNDTRANPGTYLSELYYSYSDDAGVTWSVNEALSPAFDPHVGWPVQQKMGDYFDMVSDDMGANLAYAATFNGEEDVYFIRIGDPYCMEAGTVEAKRNRYSCEDSVTVTVLDCGLNLDDETVEFVTVDVDSDSETGVEQIVLTETAASTARFEGSIIISATDASGTLLVEDGDLITVTYTDADDGLGGTNVPVTDTAAVDCVAPSISSITVTDIEAHSATVAFDANEPVRGTVRYGTACAALGESAEGSGYHLFPTVNLTDLPEDTLHYFAVDAEDEAGNPVTDDNGGSCYTFTTTDIPNYFTENFDSAANDLENSTLVFTPDGSVDFYHGCAEPITDAQFPTDPTGGTSLSIGEDDYATVTLTGGAEVSLYGTSYTTFYVGGNGYITFNSGDDDWDETLAEHFNQPRISVLYDDFSPQDGGPVSWKQLADRVAVTFENVPEYNTTDYSNFQVEMFFNGSIVLSYLAVEADDGIVGLSNGGGLPVDYFDTDLSELGSCFVDCNENGILDADDIAGGTSEDCNSNLIPDECDLADLTSLDCNANDIPDECDIAEGTSRDTNGNIVPDECELGPPVMPGAPHDTPKNRYLSFHPNCADLRTAFQVELTSSTHFPGSVGVVGWVGSVDENGVARVVDAPYYNRNWEELVHLGACEIVPAASYAIRATVDGTSFSDALEIPTTSEPSPKKWADCVGSFDGAVWSAPNGVVSMDDIMAAVQRFQSSPTAPEMTWVDVDGEDPNFVLNMTDVMRVVQGFQGLDYPFSDPADCP